MKLLHIDASANVGNSWSRRLTAGFAADWRARHPDGAVVYRDLNADPAPPVTSDLLEALHAPHGSVLDGRKRKALQISDALVEEFLGADAYVFGVPMYNFSVPGSFKTWIDHVVRIGRTWVRGPKGMEGLVRDRKLLIVSTRAGDYGKGGPREGFDFHEPYLRKVFGLVGIGNLDYLPVINSPRHIDADRTFNAAQAALKAIGARWEAETAGPGTEAGAAADLAA
jgi:FMN-dependent NADH-azoreductase